MYGINDENIAHQNKPIMGKEVAGHEKYDPVYVIQQKPDYVFSWIDRNGTPIAAGLDKFPILFNQNYQLYAVALMRPTMEGELPVILVGSFDNRLYDVGYIYGIYKRKL